MVSELSTNGDALRLFFTEDIYFVQEDPLQEDLHILAEPTAVIQRQATDKVIEFSFLGKNKRRILILVNDKQFDVSDDTGRELLRKIVKSVNLTAEDFALLNYARYEGTNFVQLKTYFNSNIVFSFGVSPFDLGLPACPENTVVNEGDARLIFSAGLTQLNLDPSSKKALWGCLQHLSL